jgi:uncharacterized metal-binding protein
MAKIGILPCGGACNVGMLTIKATIAIVNEHKEVSYVCPLGLPLGIQSIIAKAKQSDKFIAINGCEMECASKALQAVSITSEKAILLTAEYGLKKNKNFDDETKLSEIISDIRGEVDLIMAK